MARERSERGGEAPSPSRRTPLSVAELRQLITLMNGSDLEEIVIEQEAKGLRLTLRKPTPETLAPLDVPIFESDGEADDEAGGEPAEKSTVEVRASLVGIFRAAAKPRATVGDTVREGQVVGAIEALNVLNEVEAPSAGRVQEILVSDGQPVEYGQTLLVLDPIGG